MSLFPDITPLIHEVKQFNQTQAFILTELREIKQLLDAKLSKK
jgi:hypothetical protein